MKKKTTRQLGKEGLPDVNHLSVGCAILVQIEADSDEGYIYGDVQYNVLYHNRSVKAARK